MLEKQRRVSRWGRTMDLDRCVENCFQNSVYTRANGRRHGNTWELHSAHWLFALKGKLLEHTRISSRRWRFSPWARAIVLKASSLGLSVSQAQASEELRRAILEIKCTNVQVGPAAKCGVPDTGLSPLLLHMVFPGTRAPLQIRPSQNRRHRLSLRSLGNHSPNYFCSFNSETWIHASC